MLGRSLTRLTVLPRTVILRLASTAPAATSRVKVNNNFKEFISFQNDLPITRKKYVHLGHLMQVKAECIGTGAVVKNLCSTICVHFRIH